MAFIKALSAAALVTAGILVTIAQMKDVASSLIAAWLALTVCAGAPPVATHLGSVSQRFAEEKGVGAKDGDKSSDDSDSDDSEDAPDTKDPKNAAECRQSKVGLTLSIDKKAVNLEEGHLRAKMDGPICTLAMRLWRKDGVIVEKQSRYEGPEQELRWPPVPRTEIEKVEFRVTSEDGAYRAVTLTPWSVNIDHEEVEFDTNKAVIRTSEVASLEDSFDKIKTNLAKVEGKDLGPITLFIAGHTDTRGSNEHNMTLSRERAQSIAAWFQKKGLCISIAFEGFGETALKKLTADEVDEQANRRVDYILAVEPPSIKKGAAPSWKTMSKGCPSPAR
jgi:outer membrane protein OmpA-like peptidoglycan-associated protein